MRATLQNFLRKTFDLREGEIVRALLMQLNIFLIITTLLIVKPTVTGLFLSDIGVEQLPKVFILVSVFAGLISSIYARFIGRFPLNRLIIYTLSISVFLFVLFGTLLRLNILGGWILYAFYIWVSIFGVLTASQFWILANVVFNVREAKRLFGFIGTGAIAGGIFGGYLTTLLAEPLGSENLIFVGAGLLFFCIPITIYVWKSQVLPSQTSFQRKKKIGKRDHAFQIIRKSAHLSYLAGIVGVSVIIAKLVDYQFNAVASAKIPDPDELTAFLGLWFSNFNLVSLIIQLLLTRRVVGMFGVGTSLLFLPISILFGATLLFFLPELWVVIILKTSDGSLKQSINKAAVELLALPIPLETKTQTKTFIDVFIDSIATGLGGIILIFLVKGLGLPVPFISLMIIALIGVWIFFVLRVRKEYLRSFRLNMLQASTTEEDNPIQQPDQKSILEGWKKVLEAGNEQQILYALKKLKEKPDDRLFEQIYPLIHHSSDLIRASALEILYFFKSQSDIEPIENLSKDPSQKVKIAAFEYLIEHVPDRLDEFMGKYLQEADYKLQSAALVSLAIESRDNPQLRSTFQLEERLQQAYAKLSELKEGNKKNFIKIGLLKAMGAAKLPEFFPIMEVFFQDPNKKVVHQAILSAGQTLHSYFIPELIRFLDDEKKQAAAQEALSNYGDEIIPILIRYSNDPATSMETIRSFPEILEKFGRQETVEFLFEMLQKGDYNLRLAILKALNKMRKTFPYLHFNERRTINFILEEAKVYESLLAVLYAQVKKKPEQNETEGPTPIELFRSEVIQLLESRLDINLERIFRLLGLKYPPEDIIPIFERISNEKTDLRTNAVEYLDNLLEISLKKILMPIVETALLDSISEEAVHKLGLKVPNELKGFERLMQTKDTQLKLAILHLIKAQFNSSYIPLVRAATEDANPKVRKLAKDILT